MTLAEFHVLDPLDLWAALPAEVQASVIKPLLTCAFAEVVQDDDGTDASWHDRETAAGIVQDQYQAMWDALKVAFNDILGDDHTALHCLSGDMIDDTDKVQVRGMRGRRTLRTDQHGHYVRLGGKKVYVEGFKNIAEPGEPTVWEAWTVAQVDAERQRRHPEQFIGPPAPGPSFRSVIEPTTSCPTIHHEDHGYDRAAA